MNIKDFKDLPILKLEDLMLDQPNYFQRAEVCFEKRWLLLFKRVVRSQLYVKGISRRTLDTSTLSFLPQGVANYDFLETFRDIKYDRRGHSKPSGTRSIPLESITQYRLLVER